MRACAAAVSPAALCANTAAHFRVWTVAVHHCQGTCSTLTLNSGTPPSILKAVEDVEEAGAMLKECHAVFPTPRGSSDAVRCISAIHMLCVPAGSRHPSRSGKGTPLPCPWHHSSLQLLPGISSHQGLIWARARDARLSTFPCCPLSHSSKPRYQKHCTKPLRVYQVFTESPVTIVFILLSSLLPMSCCSLLDSCRNGAGLKTYPCQFAKITSCFWIGWFGLSCRAKQESRFILLICGHGK